MHKNLGNSRGQENLRTRALWGFSRLTQLKERGTPSPIDTSTFIYESTMERLCRRPFRPMADYSLARASAAAKLTAELHAQGGRTGGCWMTSSSGSADRRPSRWNRISISSSRGRSLKAGRCSLRPGRTTSFSAPTWRLLCGKICLPWWHSGTRRCWTRMGRGSPPRSFWGCWPTSRTSPTPPRSGGVWRSPTRSGWSCSCSLSRSPPTTCAESRRFGSKS